MAVYRQTDKNEDGFLDRQELAAMLDAVGMPKERAGSLFDLADVDKSGLVDFEAFKLFRMRELLP